MYSVLPATLVSSCKFEDDIRGMSKKVMGNLVSWREIIPTRVDGFPLTASQAVYDKTFKSSHHKAWLDWQAFAFRLPA
jgi:hypothetical protein